MKEFGSDFHFIPLQECSGKSLCDYFTDAIYYANGRQSIIDLYKKSGWKRLWVPEYFCYEVLSSLGNNGVNLSFYLDYPLAEEDATLTALPYEEGDALLRVNYFGLRARRSNQGIPVPVIEDHTHDLIGDWAVNSDADWCIASLRKTLPIAEGGMLWSPKALKLESIPALLPENEWLASKRWSGMKKKSRYLNNEIDDKSEFRSDMISTEEAFDQMSVSAIDNETLEYLIHFDVNRWYKQKHANRLALKDVKNPSFGFVVIEPESTDRNPFSLTLLFDTVAERNTFRKYLINHCVYPAILWSTPDIKSHEVTDFSEKMLSLHCDGRYNIDEIRQLSSIITGS